MSCSHFSNLPNSPYEFCRDSGVQLVARRKQAREKKKKKKNKGG